MKRVPSLSLSLGFLSWRLFYLFSISRSSSPAASRSVFLRYIIHRYEFIDIYSNRCTAEVQIYSRGYTLRTAVAWSC
ncbi:hypothetical protein CSUI_003102 [Cystoisospora suis]|uniref:Secreted protein n=1 Tax=Cystoisospora suis TaxID=483139 RepID=A0A2C6L6G3_9APIC|nr:hypothetical protein CSUI_003102 [Cystoisospora suis]